MKTFEQMVELEKRYLLGTYNRYPIALTRGKGVFLYDLEDRRYLDFVSGLGVNALGHGHPRIVKTIREQAGKLIHISNLYYTSIRGSWRRSYARWRVRDRRVRRECLEYFFQIAGLRRLRDRSSWRDWRDIVRVATPSRGWWRYKGLITGEHLERCR